MSSGEIDIEELINDLEINSDDEIYNLNYVDDVLDDTDEEEYNNFSINENSPVISQPDNITIPLKPHQLAMIKAMRDLEDNSYTPIFGYNNPNYKKWFQTDFACLCDKVGSGKSLTVLGLISDKPYLRNKRKCIKTYGSRIREISYSSLNLPINIIAVPIGIFNQWEKYIKKQTKLDAFYIKSSSELNKFKKFVEDYKNEPENMDHMVNFNIDLVLVSSSNYNNLCKVLEDINVSRLFVDEVDTIKVPACRELTAEFTWFITSSIKIAQNPKGIYELQPFSYTGWNGEVYNVERRVLKQKMNHMGFFRNALTEISDIYFRDQIYLRSDEEFVKKSFELPKINEFIIRCKDSIYSRVLTGIVSSDIMRMINAGDIKSAMEKSGLDNKNKDGLIKLVTKDLERNLTNLKLKYTAKEQMVYTNEQDKQRALKKLKDEIESVETKIENIKQRLFNTESCSICYDTIENRVVVTCCNNPFCYECITLSINHKNSCPLCRKALTTNDIVIVNEDKEYVEECKEEFTDHDRTKLDNLKFYLNNVMKKSKSKVLIFSEYNSSLNDIENYLKNSNYKFSHLKGTSNIIAKTISKFKEGDTNILLLNSQYFGSGINLENTTDLFMFHKMKDNIDQQVIGRAQRPGRKSPLNLYRLCHDNEL
jgi:hypothetical protein